MAAAVESELGLRAEMVPGNGGIFEVVLDHVVVYTNNHQGGVPESPPVIEAIRSAM